MFFLIFLLLTVGQTVWAAMGDSSKASGGMRDMALSSAEALNKIKNLAILRDVGITEAQKPRAVVVLGAKVPEKRAKELLDQQKLLARNPRFVTEGEGTVLLSNGDFLDGLHWVSPEYYSRGWNGVRRTTAGRLGKGPNSFVVTALFPTDPVITHDVFRSASEGMDIGRGTETMRASIRQAEVEKRLASGQVGRGFVLVDKTQIAIGPLQRMAADSLDFRRVVFYDKGVAYSAVFVVPKTLEMPIPMDKMATMVRSMTMQMDKTPKAMDKTPKAMDEMPMAMDKMPMETISMTQALALTMEQKDAAKKILKHDFRKSLTLEEAKKAKHLTVAVPEGMDEKKAQEILTKLELSYNNNDFSTHKAVLEAMDRGKFLNGVHWVGRYDQDFKGTVSATVGAYAGTTVTTILPTDPVLSREELQTLLHALPVATNAFKDLGLEKNFVSSLKFGEHVISQKRAKVGVILIVPDNQIRIAPFARAGYMLKRFVYYNEAKAYSVLVATSSKF